MADFPAARQQQALGSRSISNFASVRSRKTEFTHWARSCLYGRYDLMGPASNVLLKQTVVKLFLYPKLECHCGEHIK
jgi:hypothetical protein